MKEHPSIILVAWSIVCILFGFIGVLCVVQALLCPDLTQTEIFLRIPNFFMIDFIKC